MKQLLFAQKGFAKTYYQFPIILWLFEICMITLITIYQLPFYWLLLGYLIPIIYLALRCITKFQPLHLHPFFTLIDGTFLNWIFFLPMIYFLVGLILKSNAYIFLYLFSFITLFGLWYQYHRIYKTTID